MSLRLLKSESGRCASMTRARSFGAKFAGYNNRILTWTCVGCGQPHTQKPQACAACRNEEFHYFQSKAEAQRYADLILQETLQAITGLRVHPKFPVRALGEDGAHHLIFTYVADFAYIRDGEEVIEDVKPSKDARSFDAIFKLKRRAVEKVYGIAISIFAKR